VQAEIIPATHHNVINTIRSKDSVKFLTEEIADLYTFSVIYLFYYIFILFCIYPIPLWV